MGINQAIHDSIWDLEEERKMEQQGQLQKYVDKSMFEAAPMASVTPKVHLLWMTEDPLGAVSAAMRMYKGIPTYDLSEITDQERNSDFLDIQKTHLKAPLEFVKLHFFIEGVDRAFTHQVVRQRTAVFAQESLRFAVKENLAQEVPVPPSFYNAESPSAFNDLEKIWSDAIGEIERAYKTLIANGIPAEDARGLLPHAVTTRLHFCTDLRNLSDHSGNRLCTQAQFHWRTVFLQIVEQIRNYGYRMILVPVLGTSQSQQIRGENIRGWQFEAIADSPLFAPVCYQQGHCTFKSDIDRGCTIRQRVDAMAANGVPSSQWGQDQPTKDGKIIPRISDEEWRDDPKAAWQ